MMSANATCAQTPTQEFENSAYAYDARHQAVFGDADTFAYDSSGNRVSSYNGGIRKDTLVYTAHTNRVLKRLEAQGAWLTYYDDPNGSRTSEKPPTYPSAGLRLYFYNAIGQTTGIEENYGNQGDSTLGGPDWCRYDALGRRVFSCDLVSSSGTAVFDGDNVVGVQTFRFVHGPGTDDPLIGLGYAGGSTWDKFFYLSDGAGRLLAFTDTLGFSLMNSAQYGLNGGNQAGAITQSTGFANSRSESPQAPGVSFYRNRYYDQGSGRWTQEDPAGIAGGANLYTYVGNNPVMFTDPFGLRADSTCPPHCTEDEANRIPLARRPDDADGKGSLKHPLIDPVAILAGGLAGAADGMLFGAGENTLANATAASGGQVGPEFIGNAISGFTKHGINSVINKGISPSALLEAARNGVARSPVVDALGRESIRIVGEAAGFAINLLGKVVTVWPK
jgi:RHS repeat-associated protein